MQNTVVNAIEDREQLKHAWRALLLSEPPADEVWARWYHSYRPLAGRLIREMILSLAKKYQRESGFMSPLHLERFAESIICRMLKEREEVAARLKAEIVDLKAKEPLIDKIELGEDQWNR